MSRESKQHKKDPQYKEAKNQGYRARSAFKLFEIQRRFNLFKRAFYILDIGSAPGSWLQVSKKMAEENLEKYNDSYYHRDHYRILGIDTKKISPIEHVETIKMDITDPSSKQVILKHFNGKKLDLILSDASINKSGNKFSDQARQVHLCEKILALSELLKENGTMLIKVFQGADFDKFFHRMKRRFFTVRSYKPQASNKKSNEIYLIGLKKR